MQVKAPDWMVAEMGLGGEIHGGGSRYKRRPHEGMRHDCLRMDGYQVSMMTGGLATMISSSAVGAVWTEALAIILYLSQATARVHG